jgi:hypothetical protein
LAEANGRAHLCANLAAYRYNTGTITEPAKYVALEAGNNGAYFSVGGKAPSSANGWTYVSKSGGHPYQSNFAIVQWSVPERGLYSLTKTLATGPDSAGNGDGVEIKVFVVASAEPLSKLTAADMVKVIDNNVVFGVNRGITNMEYFDGMLGLLPAGARVFVCLGSGPAGNSGSDDVSFDFAISRGPVPALTPGGAGVANSELGIPLLGGAIFTSTSIMWSGVAKPGVFNEVLIGSDTPRLASGTYFVTTNAISTNAAGGRLWGVSFSSSIFQWTNDVTNGNIKTDLDSHSSGHASNGEVMTFSTVEMPANTNKRTRFGFAAKIGWTARINIQFDFVRLH